MARSKATRHLPPRASKFLWNESGFNEPTPSWDNEASEVYRQFRLHQEDGLECASRTCRYSCPGVLTYVPPILARSMTQGAPGSAVDQICAEHSRVHLYMGTFYCQNHSSERSTSCSRHRKVLEQWSHGIERLRLASEAKKAKLVRALDELSLSYHWSTMASLQQDLKVGRRILEHAGLPLDLLPGRKRPWKSVTVGGKEHEISTDEGPSPGDGHTPGGRAKQSKLFRFWKHAVLNLNKLYKPLLPDLALYEYEETSTRMIRLTLASLFPVEFSAAEPKKIRDLLKSGGF